MIINSELFLRTFQIIESGAASHLIHTPSVLCKTFSPQKDMPPAGQAAKNPARGNLGRDIVVRISRYNRPESIATGDRHPRARYRCDAEGPLLNRPCIGRILFAVAHHLFPTGLQLISLSLGLDDNRLRIVAGPVETGLVRAIILNASSQQRTVSDIHFSRAADVE